MPNLGGKISLDISEFQAKITEANKLIRSNESAWRASAAQMDDWSKSEDGIKQRLDASNKQVELQRNIIATLVEKRKALVEEYGEESKEVDKVNAEIIKYSKALEKSISENKQFASMLDKVQAERSDEKTAVERATKVTKENTNAVDKNASEYGGLTSAIKKAGDGFTIFKGVVAGLVANALTAAVKSITSFAHAVNTLPENTRALRKELTQLETAFNDVGLSADAAKETYINYTAVLGGVDSNANTTISLLASMVTSEEQLTTWTTALAGVYAKLGTAIPTNELTKNIQQTSNTAKMTENLTKVMNSAGIDTEEFAQQLTALNTSEERSALILSTLNNAYGTLGAQYVENNRQMIAAEKAQLKLNTAMTLFGDMLEPIKTDFTNTWAEIVSAFGTFLSGDDSVLPELAYNIGYLVGSIGRIWDTIYSVLEPHLTSLKDKITGWFDDNKTVIVNKIKAWASGIFGEDTTTAIAGIANTIMQPVKDVLDDIKNEDWEALGIDALPIITLSVGVALLKSALTDFPAALSQGLSTAFTAKSMTMAGAVAGMVGVISLGIELKDAMKSGDYKTWANKALQSILDGLAVYGVTGSLTLGAFAFALSATLDVSITEFTGDIAEKLGLSGATIAIGASLTAGAMAGVKTAITSGLAAGLGKAWTASAVSTGILGTVAIGFKLKDALTTGEYDELMDSLVSAVIAGLAVAGITGSVKAGVIAFGIAAQLDFSLNKMTTELSEILAMDQKEIIVALSLAAGTVKALLDAIKLGIYTVSGISASAAGYAGAVMGVVSIAVQLQNAMKTGDYSAFIENLIAAIAVAGLTYGLTYSPTLSAFAFGLVLDLEIGSKIADKVKMLSKAIGNIVTGGEIERETVEIDDPNAITTLGAAHAGAKQYANLTLNTPVILTLGGGVEIKSDAQIYADIAAELETLLVGATAKIQLENVLTNATKGGKEIAEAVAEGFDIGLDDMAAVSELQAKMILAQMREVLGIHSPSKEAEYLGEMFTQGFKDGLEGLTRVTEEETENAVDAAFEQVTQVKGFWGQLWDNFKSKITDGWNTFKGAFVNAWEYVKKSFTSWEGFFDMLKDGVNGVKSAFMSVGEIVSEVLGMYDAEEGAASIYNGIMDKATTALINMGGWFSVIGIVLQLILDAIESGDADEYIRQVVEALIEGINMIFENTPLIIDMVLTAMKEIAEGFIDNLPEWIEKIPDIIEYLINAVLENLPDFIQLGFELFAAIVEGVWKAIKSIGNKIVNGIKSLFGIHSPSQVMREEVGRNLGRGVVEGLKDTIPEINATMRAVNTKLSSDGVTTAAGTGGKIVYVTQNNNYSRSYSAYELYKSERAIKQLVGAY